MLSSIVISGFKSISKPTTIPLGNLTLFAGANSSGKTSAIQALLMLKQTAESVYSDSLLLNGPLVTYTMAEQFLSTCDGKADVRELTLGLRWGYHDGYDAHFSKRGKGPITLDKSEYFKGELILSIDKCKNSDHFRHLIVEDDNLFNAFYFPGFRDYYKDASIKAVPMKCFLVLGIENKGVVLLGTGIEQYAATKVLNDIIHVPGLRGNPERSYPLVSYDTTFRAPFQQYSASIIAQWQSSDDDKIGALSEYLRKLELTWKVTASMINDVEIDLRVGRTARAQRGRSKDLVSIADVGLGVSQVLPIVVALMAARIDQTVIIEQPEIHLHPRAIAGFVDIVVEAINRGVQVVIETHSDILLLAIQTAVAEGSISGNKTVLLHWFTRQPDSGLTQISSSIIDAKGSIGKWPEDFGSFAMEQQSRFLRAHNK